MVPGLFFYPQTTNQLVVDTARGETLTINVSCVVPPPHWPQICFPSSQTFSLENSQHLICVPRNHFEELPNIRLCALPIVQKIHFNLQPKTKKAQHSSANFRVSLNLGFWWWYCLFGIPPFELFLCPSLACCEVWFVSHLGTFTDLCTILSCVKLDITFPSLACSAVSLDALDISGEQHHDIVSFFSSIGSIVGFALLHCTMSIISSALLCCP